MSAILPVTILMSVRISRMSSRIPLIWKRLIASRFSPLSAADASGESHDAAGKRRRQRSTPAPRERPEPCIPAQRQCVRATLILMTWLTWSLLSALFAAATAILAKLGVAGVDANLATAVRTSVVVVFTWLLACVTRPPAGFQALSSKSWIFLVLSGLATGLSWLCYFHALQVGPASRVAPIDKLSVALVILFAALFLGERLTWGKGIGGLLIVAGAITIALE